MAWLRIIQCPQTVIETEPRAILLLYSKRRRKVTLSVTRERSSVNQNSRPPFLVFKINSNRIYMDPSKNGAELNPPSGPLGDDEDPVITALTQRARLFAMEDDKDDSPHVNETMPPLSSVVTDIDDQTDVVGGGASQEAEGKQSDEATKQLIEVKEKEGAEVKSGGMDKQYSSSMEMQPQQTQLSLQEVADAQRGLVEKHSSSLRESLDVLMSSLKDAMQGQSDRLLNATVTKHNEERNKLLDDLHSLKEENFELMDHKTKSLKFKAALAESVWRKNKRHSDHITRNHFKGWVQALRDTRAEETRLSWAEAQLHSRIRSRILNRWNRRAHERKLQITVSFWEAKMRKALAAYIQRYEEELNHTRVQLEEAKAANREQKKIKSSIEQKMKQAFLRQTPPPRTSL
eukprot:jgi/Bigna1/91543/estExt_fgenesh1_pg.C_1050020